MPLHVFAPSSAQAYVIATSLSDPSLVIDRRTGCCRIAPPTELVSLIGPAGNRARSFQLQAVVGLVSFPDDMALVVVNGSQARGIATERGPTSVASVTRTVFLMLKPESERGEALTEQWQPPIGEPSGASAGATGGERAAEVGAKQRKHLKDLLEAGDFFFDPHSAGGELTHTLQRRAARRAEAPAPAPAGGGYEASDERFVWNAAALAPIAEAGPGPWLTVLMQGAIASEQLQLPGGGFTLTASLISRRSCEHAGTRLKARGVNDAGAAANFVESEQILHLSHKASGRSACAAVVHVRGSAPVFWEQKASLKSITPKPRVSRVTELAAPAFRAHVGELNREYGPVLLLSLLDEKGDESELAAALEQVVSRTSDPAAAGGAAAAPALQMRLIRFDFHAHCKGSSRADGLATLTQRLSTAPDEWRPGAMGFFAHVGGNDAPSRTQRGVVRTNCLDCLNRTNMAQAVLALQSASEQLRGLCRACGLAAVHGEEAPGENQVQAALRRLWTECGDQISIQYTGTANLSKGSHLTGDAPKKSLIEKASGFVEKASRTVNRYVHEQFLEDTKQGAIESLLSGGCDPSTGGAARCASGAGGASGRAARRCAARTSARSSGSSARGTSTASRARWRT